MINVRNCIAATHEEICFSYRVLYVHNKLSFTYTISLDCRLRIHDKTFTILFFNVAATQFRNYKR